MVARECSSGLADWRIRMPSASPHEASFPDRRRVRRGQSSQPPPRPSKWAACASPPRPPSPAATWRSTAAACATASSSRSTARACISPARPRHRHRCSRWRSAKRVHRRPARAGRERLRPPLFTKAMQDNASRKTSVSRSTARSGWARPSRRRSSPGEDHRRRLAARPGHADHDQRQAPGATGEENPVLRLDAAHLAGRKPVDRKRSGSTARAQTKRHDARAVAPAARRAAASRSSRTRSRRSAG